MADLKILRGDVESEFLNFFNKVSHLFPLELKLIEKVDMAIHVWNLANVTLTVPPEVYEEKKALGNPEDFEDIVLELIEIKRKISGNCTDCILRYDAEGFSLGRPLSLETVSVNEFIETVSNEDMDDFDDDFDPADDSGMDEEGLLDRFAIVLIPKKPFIDWVNNSEPEGQTYKIDPSIYLVPEYLGTNVEEHLRKKFEKYFKAELENWGTNKKSWPKNRNFKMFTEWFQIVTTPFTYDFVKAPIYKN